MVKAPSIRDQKHSLECTKLISRPYQLMSELDDLQQSYVLLCPHPEHDVVRRFMGYKEQLDPSTRQLVRIHA